MRLTVCCCLLLLAVGVRGQGDFDLSDGLDETTKTTNGLKTTEKPQSGEGGFATDGTVDIPRKPPTKPQPGDHTPKKTTSKPDDFDLHDGVIGGNDPFNKPTRKPQPGHGGSAGGGGEASEFGDDDLGKIDPNAPSGHDDQSGGKEQGQGGENQSVVAGIVGAVAATAVAAVSSFIAYQKKKLCFKGATDDPENVNMDSHKGDQSEPQVQSTLLAK